MRADVRLAVRWAAYGVGLHLLVIAPILVANGPSWFLHLGRAFPPAIELAREELEMDVVVPHVDGHDGRAFWVLARDPLLLDGDEAARLLDRPSYRAQRIAYPALAAPWRAAGEDALVWGLLVTNLAIVAAGSYLAVRLADAVGAPARASLAFAAAPPVIVSTLGNLGDGLAIAALLAMALALARRRLAWAAVAAVVAALAKESTLLAVVPLALLWPAVPRRTRIALVGAPIAALAAWLLYSRWRLGWPSTSVQEFTWPFAGYADAWERGFSYQENWADAVAAFALVPIAVYGAVRWWRSGSVLAGAALPSLALVPFFTAQVLAVLLNSLRALGPAITLLWLDAYARAGPRATPSIGRLPLVDPRASRRSTRRSRPSPVGPRG